MGEVEMGDNGPIDHPYELLIRVMEMEVEKLQAVLGAADAAENADTLLSVVEIARPRSVIKMVSAAGAEAIESAVKKGTSALRDASAKSVSADLDRAKIHLRRTIERLEDQIEQARRIIEKRRTGEEQLDEFRAAQEREVLERHLKDAFNRHYSEIKDNATTAEQIADSAKKESGDKYSELVDYQKLYSIDKSLYNKDQYASLEREAVNAHDSWKIAEGKLKEAEFAASSLDSDKKAFASGDIEEKVEIVGRLQSAMTRVRLDFKDTNNPFGR